MPVYQQAKREYRTYYVVFQKSKHRRPWHCFTWNGFQHVWLFYPKYLGPPGLLTPRGTIKVEPLSTFIDTDYWPFDPEYVASEFLKAEYVLDIVKITLPIFSTKHYHLRGFINCVTIVKSVMGLCSFFTLTPQQLRRYLLRIGGESLNQCQPLNLKT